LTTTHGKQIKSYIYCHIKLNKQNNWIKWLWEKNTFLLTFSWAVRAIPLDLTYNFCWWILVHQSGCIDACNNRYWSSINLRQTFENSFMIRRLVCCVTLLLYK
jgi:hypothetical protein